MNSKTQDYSCIVTGYEGYEDEILRLRNSNRSNTQTRRYLDWRYGEWPDGHQPRVFWLMSVSGHRVGMASLIFRLYWVNNQPCHIAVLGDISLDASVRGKGLGQKLLQFLSEYIDEHLSDSLAFVIPNVTAQKSLTASGWKVGGKLIPFVFPLNPTEKLCRLFRSRWLAASVAWLFRKSVSSILRYHLKEGYSMHMVDEFDDSFEAFWRDFPKAGLTVRDRGVASLTWRYGNHPHHKFKVAKFVRKGQLWGYFVLDLSEQYRTCFVYEIIVREQSDVGCMVALLVEHCNNFEDINTIRLLLNDCHPYSRGLWRLGFIPRKSQGVFQVYSPNGLAQPAASTWAITFGDKDI